MSPAEKPITNALTVDVEDYYQVQALAGAHPMKDWDSRESRVERGADAILQTFADAGVKATFFTLGWIAERHPALVRRIVAEGHELASHGYCHTRVDSQTPEAFAADIRKTRTILEDIGGTPVIGYRAATFSVGPTTPWAWSVLEQEGYRYSSSVYPVARDNYGSKDAPRAAYRPPGGCNLIEIPISTVRMGHRNWPCGGGGFFRLLPYWVSREAIARVNRADRTPVIFYLHPWELDPDQPRSRGVPLKSRVRHYLNLGKTQPRLERLVRAFQWDRMDRVFRLDQPPEISAGTSAP
jgi:polysaccharide deacetylase family protein (PEP-CTERM system associated)